MGAPHSLSNLIRHFYSNKSKPCREKYEEWKKEIQRLQPKLSSVVRGEIRFGILTPDVQAHLDKLLGNFIVFSEVPLRLIEGEEFRSFCKGLNPKYNVPYTRKLKNLFLSQCWKIVKRNYVIT